MFALNIYLWVGLVTGVIFFGQNLLLPAGFPTALAGPDAVIDDTHL